jgi:hypothetical protein
MKFMVLSRFWVNQEGRKEGRRISIASSSHLKMHGISVKMLRSAIGALCRH